MNKYANILALVATVLLVLTCPGQLKAEEPTVAQLYTIHCAACHGGDRLGGIGPALLPENLKRLRTKAATSVITSGRPSTQMPGFEQVRLKPKHRTPNSFNL